MRFCRPLEQGLRCMALLGTAGLLRYARCGCVARPGPCVRSGPAHAAVAGSGLVRRWPRWLSPSCAFVARNLSYGTCGSHVLCSICGSFMAGLISGRSVHYVSCGPQVHACPITQQPPRVIHPPPAGYSQIPSPSAGYPCSLSDGYAFPLTFADSHGDRHPIRIRIHLPPPLSQSKRCCVTKQSNRRSMERGRPNPELQVQMKHESLSNT